MNVDRMVHSTAGAMILASLALAHWHSPYWLWLTAFVGANLFQSGLTNMCPLAPILAKVGVRSQGVCGLKDGPRA
jgi:hypothetical protein